MWSCVQHSDGARKVPLCIELKDKTITLMSTMLSEATSKYLDASSDEDQCRFGPLLCSLIELLGQQAAWSDRMAISMQEEDAGIMTAVGASSVTGQTPTSNATVTAIHPHWQ